MSDACINLFSILKDIHGFTDIFLKKFYERLSEKYGQELRGIEINNREGENLDTETVYVDNVDQEFVRVMDVQEHPDSDELKLHNRYNGQAFSTQARKIPQQRTFRDEKARRKELEMTLGQVLADNISTKLSKKVNQHIKKSLIYNSPRPSDLIDTITSGITKNVRQQREVALNVHRVNREGNERANLPVKDQRVQRASTVSATINLKELDGQSGGDITKLP